MPRSYIDEAVCPACAGLGMEYNTEQVDLPYMGNSLEIVLRCEKCGYRHTDFVLTQQREPTRYRYLVTKSDDMMVRVVRSSSCTIRMPELGITIEPGAVSEAFISNIEGIIVRVERVLDQMRRDADDDIVRQRAQDLQETFDQMREGTAPPTSVVLEDPLGNSMIIGEGVERELIPEAEADQLKVGMFIFDKDGDATPKEDRP